MRTRHAIVAALLVAFAGCQLAKAELSFEPEFPRAGGSFRVIATGWFSYVNSITGHYMSVSTTNICIDMYAYTYSVGLPAITPWRFVTQLPPLTPGNYSIVANLHGTFIMSGHTQATNVSLSWPSVRIEAPQFEAAASTNVLPTFGFSFRGNTGSTYSVQGSEDLITWTNTHGPLTLTNWEHTVKMPQQAIRRFYRVIEASDE